jgi:hypothetical protein
MKWGELIITPALRGTQLTPHQQRAEATVGSCGDDVVGHVYSSICIDRGFPRILRYWASTYTGHCIFLVDLVPAVTYASYDAT